MNPRSIAAEFIGTALLVIMAVGVATLMFGFKLTGFSVGAGVTTTALAFGLVLAGLAYALGPISGCHINPAVTMGFWLSGRIPMLDAAAYWVAQVAGGITGAAVLDGLFHLTSRYRPRYGLGANGYGPKLSIVGVNASGAFLVEVILTFLFVFVVLTVTRRSANATVVGLVIGFALAIVHLMGIAFTGTSVNPARSIGPALIVGGTPLHQLWLFILAPLAGGSLAALTFRLLYPEGEEEATTEPAPEMQVP
jgi:aquaporin Z